MRVHACGKLVWIALFTTLSSAGKLPVLHIKQVKKAMNSSSSSTSQQCTFHTVKYNISQTWYPLLLPYGYFSCIKCVCTMSNGSAKVVCNKKQCNKTKCSNAHIIAGDCCKKCPGPSNGQAANASTCTNMGKTYPHGSVWKTADPNDGDLCTECSCSDGFVSCAIRICPKANCSRPITVPGTCCKQCISNRTKIVKQTRCDSLGRYYQEGEEWYPLVSSYRHKCIICTCKNSKTHCSKVSCSNSNCNKKCCKKCKVPVPTTVLPTTKKPTVSNKQVVKYPDCYTGSLHKHNTSWTPIIIDMSLACVTCKCLYSRVSCSRIICPQKYPCAKPIKKVGECCKQCKGQSPTKVKLIRLGWKNKRPCGSGNAWRVYEYSPGNRTKTSSSNVNEIHGHFILESTLKDKVEVHTFRANKTYKHIRVQEMYKADLQRWKKMSSKTMKLREIGIIKDARRQKMEIIRNRKKCTNNCIQVVKNLIQMVRLRSRWCRSPKPYGLKMLENPRKSWKLLQSLS